MTDTILILNTTLSGVNNFIFSQLKKRGWELIIVNVPFPRIYMIQAMIFSFHPNIYQWKQNYFKLLGKLNKSSWTFIQRTRFCEKTIQRFNNKFNLILQISGLFAPTLNYQSLKIPYVTFNDYTVNLSNKYPDWSPSSSQIKKWLSLEKELYSHAQLIFTVSENTRRSFINDYGISPEKILTVRYGPTLERMPIFSNKNDEKMILFVGKDFKRKGGFVLLDAFKKVRAVIKDARLVIVGPKDDLKIVQSGVEVLGYVTEKSIVEDLFTHASVFVMPSFCEPFGLVFLEAMAYKLPCIGTMIDAMPEIIEDGKSGFLVSPGDSNSLAEKILILLGDNDLSRRMGMEGYKRLNQYFNWDISGEKIHQSLKQCLKII